MAKVFTGKVVIPRDRFGEYLDALQAAEDARAPFQQHLEQLNREFEEDLLSKYTKRTARKHTQIVELFIHFICGYTDVNTVEDITKGMVNSHFRKWYKRKVWDSATESDLRIALKKFFQFLDREKNITNQVVLSTLK